ncbi:hypothetical protein AOA57_02865 [Pseudomonas sp. 2588-5]|nr:hypothetical protein AOA57_02865 [Pseudomonas sp. 2588-5]
MQNFSDPDLDSALIATIHHECFLMKSSFDEFLKLGEKQILGELNELEKVRLFSSYSAFLHHLYEFCVACFMREQGSDEGFSGRAGAQKKDGLFFSEASRVFRGIHHRVKAGQGFGWENAAEYYDVQVPADFGTKFRQVRNSTAHAITERSSGEVDLSEFFENYHKYIMELYRSAYGYWGRFEIEKLDMKAIGDFSVVTRSIK